MTNAEKIARWLSLPVVVVGVPSEEGLAAVWESVERSLSEGPAVNTEELEVEIEA